MNLIAGERYRGCICIVILLLSLVIPLQPVAVEAQNRITTSGVLADNETWSGRIHITGDVVVPRGITLTVQPGTVITFTPNSSDNDVKISVLEELGLNKCNLIVKGNLRVEGERNNKVLLGGVPGDFKWQAPIIWAGILFEGTNASSVIKHSEIRYALVALVFSGSSTPRIVNTLIADNDVGIVTFDFSSPQITASRIEKNTLWGISCYDHSFPLLSQNTIKDSEVGVGCEDSSFPIIEYNRFGDNSVDILIQHRSNPETEGNIFDDTSEGI